MAAKQVRSSPQPIRKILVAVDLSAQSQGPLLRAARLPLAADAAITLLHVLPPGMPSATRRKAEMQASELLRRAARTLSRTIRRDKNKARSVETELAVGTPWEAILSRARSTDAELVILGAHNRRKFGNIFLGSTANRVIRRGEFPVLIASTLPAGSYSRPLVAVDLEPPSSEVLETALRLFPSEVSKARVVHCYTVPFEGFIFPALSSQQLAEYREETRKNARAGLCKLLEGVDSDNCELKPVLRAGDPRKIIPREAMSHKADLIVLGTHGRTGWSRSMLGSVAEWVLRAAECDVLVARPRR